MTEELTETTPEEVPAEEATEAPGTEAPSDELPAEIIELVKSVDAEVLKNVKNLDEFYKRVNRKSMEAAEMMKKAEALLHTQPQTPTGSDDDTPDLDENAQKVLRRFLEKELGPVFSTLVEERRDSNQEIWADFTGAHTDVPADVIAEKFYELGFDQTANTPVKYKHALEKAYKLAKAETVDIDALIEERVAERIKDVKKEGGDVVAVREKRTPIEPAPKSDAATIEQLQREGDWSKLFGFLNAK